jgi:hypothetical protein
VARGAHLTPLCEKSAHVSSSPARKAETVHADGATAHGETTAAPAAGQASMQSPAESGTPAQHWHSALPEEDSELAGHVEQVPGPLEGLNVPGGHTVHVADPLTFV